MGYRKAKENSSKWMKPIGNMLLVFDEEDNRLLQYFNNNLGEISIWSSESMNMDALLDSICSFEQYKLRVIGQDVTNFAFLLPEENAKIELNYD